MNSKTLWGLALIFCFGCTSMMPGEGADFDLGNTQLRHGWAIIPKQERTLVGVNDNDSIARGKDVFEKNCMVCHGPKGLGDGPLAKSKNIKPANLQNVSRQSPNHYMFMQIQKGKNDMPAWKDTLTTQQAWDVTNYIQTLKNKK